jgi:hypothetical protein
MNQNYSFCNKKLGIFIKNQLIKFKNKNKSEQNARENLPNIRKMLL